eukprot:6261235-Karenia_brevis.AAC.1
MKTCIWRPDLHMRPDMLMEATSRHSRDAYLACGLSYAVYRMTYTGYGVRRRWYAVRVCGMWYPAYGMWSAVCSALAKYLEVGIT